MAARDGQKSAAPSRAVPSSARRARSRHCDVDMSACTCKNVQWSCLCSAVEMCVGVCTVGARARVLARACVHVPRRGCRTRLPVLETAGPLSSCRTTGRSPRARGHPPWRAVQELFLLVSDSDTVGDSRYSMHVAPSRRAVAWGATTLSVRPDKRQCTIAHRMLCSNLSLQVVAPSQLPNTHLRFTRPYTVNTCAAQDTVTYS